MIENAYAKFVHILRNFTNNTNRHCEEDRKRTVNYLDWNSLKTVIYQYHMCLVYQNCQGIVTFTKWFVSIQEDLISMELMEMYMVKL